MCKQNHFRFVITVALWGGWFLYEAPTSKVQAQDAKPRTVPPSLVAFHGQLKIDTTASFARAEDAIREAKLTANAPTGISRGGFNDYLTVIIHCIGVKEGTMLDLEVAGAPGFEKETVAMRVFLRDYMMNGKTQVTGDFTGDWSMKTPPGITFNSHLKQEGNHVTGSYAVNGGTVDGTVVGKTLRLAWTQDNAKGAAQFVLADDGKSFTGFWSYTNDPDDKSGGYWNGTRN